MASIFHSPPVYLPRNPTNLHFSPSILPFLSCRTPSPHLHLRALKVASDGGSVGSRDAYSPNLRRKPVISPVNDDDGSTTGASSDIPGSDVEGATGEGNMGFNQREEDEWVDWEDQILEDTVPLVGLVRMILHSGKYGSGDKLSPGHEKTILERLLPYHPEFEKKIGCGIDYIMLGYHPEFENSRCLFIARKDGELVDFSYWKCIKGLIRKNYPQYAESFILRHLRWRKRNE